MEENKEREAKIKAQINAAQKELQNAFKLEKEAEDKRSKIEAETQKLMGEAADQKIKADNENEKANSMKDKAMRAAEEAERLVKDATERYNEMLNKSKMDKD